MRESNGIPMAEPGEPADDINKQLADLALKLEFYIEELRGGQADLEKRLTNLENEVTGYDP